MRTAIVDTSRTPQLVVNVIDYPTDLNGTVPPGMAAPMLAVTGNDRVSPGWTYVNGVLMAPPPPPPPVPPTIDEIYDATILQQRVLKAIVLALNDGTLPIGQNLTAAQLKTIIKARM